MRQGAGKAETVAGDEQEGLAVDPELELAAQDDAGFLASMGIGAVAGGGARLEAAGQELERAGEGRAEQFVGDSRREIEAPAPGAADDDIALGGGRLAGLEEPADGDAERPADRVQRVDRRRRAIALQEAEITDREAARLRHRGQG